MVLCKIDGRGQNGPLKILFKYTNHEGNIQIFLSRLFLKPTRINCNNYSYKCKPEYLTLGTDEGTNYFKQHIYLSVESENRHLKMWIKAEFTPPSDSEGEDGKKSGPKVAKREKKGVVKMIETLVDKYNVDENVQ